MTMPKCPPGVEKRLKPILMEQGFHYRPPSWFEENKIVEESPEAKKLIDENAQKIAAAVAEYTRKNPLLFSSELESVVTDLAYKYDTRRGVKRDTRRNVKSQFVASALMTSGNINTYPYPSILTTPYLGDDGADMNVWGLNKKGNPYLTKNSKFGYMLLVRALEETIEDMGGAEGVMKSLGVTKHTRLRHAADIEQPYLVACYPPFPGAPETIDFNQLEKFLDDTDTNFVYHNDRKEMIEWFERELERRTAFMRGERDRRIELYYKPKD